MIKKTPETVGYQADRSPPDGTSITWLATRRANHSHLASDALSMHFGTSHWAVVDCCQGQLRLTTSATGQHVIADEDRPTLLAALSLALVPDTYCPDCLRRLLDFQPGASATELGATDEAESGEWELAVEFACGLAEAEADGPAHDLAAAALQQIEDEGDLRPVLADMFRAEPPALSAANYQILMSDPGADLGAINDRLRCEPEVNLEDPKHLRAAESVALLLLSRYIELERVTLDGPAHDGLQLRLERAVAAGDVGSVARHLADEWPTASHTQIGDLIASMLTTDQRARLNDGDGDCWLLADDLASEVWGHRGLE